MNRNNRKNHDTSRYLFLHINMHLEVSLGHVHLSVIPDALWAHCQGITGNVSFSCWVDILSECSCYYGSCCLQGRGPYVPTTITEKNRTNPRIPSSQNITFSKCARFPLTPQFEPVENESLSYILGHISQVISRVSVGSHTEQQREERLDSLSLLSGVLKNPSKVGSGTHKFVSTEQRAGSISQQLLAMPHYRILN